MNRFLCLLAISLAAFAWPDDGADASRCSLSTNMGPASSNQTLLLAVPLKEWVPVRLTDADWQALRGMSREDLPRPADAVNGHLFRIVAADAGAPELEGMRAGAEIIVVPWHYGSACDAVVWKRPGEWIRSDTVVFTVVRQLMGTADARPVLHVLGEHAPYPDGEFLKYEDRRRTPREEWLTASQYFSLLTTVPRRDAASLDAQRGALHAWRSDNPTLVSRFPATNVADALQNQQ